MHIRDFLRRCSLCYADKVAYIDGERRSTWAQVRARSLKLAAALQALGIGKGDAVAMLSYDQLEAVEHVYACLEIGALRVGVNRGYAPNEMAGARQRRARAHRAVGLPPAAAAVPRGVRA